MGFGKNSKFPNRLTLKVQHVKLDVIIFFYKYSKQSGIFKRSTAALEYFVMKYFPPRPP